MKNTGTSANFAREQCFRKRAWFEDLHQMVYSSSFFLPFRLCCERWLAFVWQTLLLWLWSLPKNRTSFETPMRLPPGRRRQQESRDDETWWWWIIRQRKGVLKFDTLCDKLRLEVKEKDTRSYYWLQFGTDSFNPIADVTPWYSWSGPFPFGTNGELRSLTLTPVHSAHAVGYHYYLS